MNNFTKNDTFITKGCAILLLLFHHLFYDDFLTNAGKHYNYFLMPISNILCKYGNICIFVFSCLTGYAIFQKLKEETPINLIVKYEINLLSVFIIVYLICSIIMILDVNGGVCKHI